MKTPRCVLAMGIALAMAGCVPSIHPIYTDADLVFDPALAGEWNGDANETWVFTKTEEKAYRLVYTDKEGKTGKFQAHLAKIGGRLFIDLYPEEPDLQANGFYKLHLIPMHTFLLVTQIAPALQMAAMDHDWLKKHLAEHPSAIRHELRDDRVILTASTKELQGFLLAHLSENGLFGKPSDFQRKPAAPKP